MLQCSFPFVAALLLVELASAVQKFERCSAISAAQLSENQSATSVFASGMLQGWGLEGWGLGLAEQEQAQNKVWFNSLRSAPPAKVARSLEPRIQSQHVACAVRPRTVRDLLKALETTTAIQRDKIRCK